MLYTATADNSYATIDAVIENIENFPNGNVIKYMVDINYMDSCWTAKDYVDYCYLLKPSNQILKMAKLLMLSGAPISTVSRLASSTSNCFSSQALVDYVNGSSLAMLGVDAARALELYRLCIEMGFSKTFVNQRYLSDYINVECDKTSMQEVIDKLSSVNDAIVQQIESLSPEEKAMNGIRDILDCHY